MTTTLLLGVDVGTSDSKVLATTLAGAEICSVAHQTHWDIHHGRQTDTDPEVLADGVFTLMGRAVEAAAALLGPVEVAGVAFAGMAEAGVLTTADGVVAHPVIAWFDPRGGAEINQAPADLLAEFPARTGLPVSSLATISKLLWMRGQGTRLAGAQWLNVPEFLAVRLGGVAASEVSLASRTGLLDQTTGALWPAALDLIGATPDLIPPLVQAGTPLGRITAHRAPAVLHGAVITVAGHDHPVAAVGSGAVGTDEVFDSFGTAEALVRSIRADQELDLSARGRLAAAGVNVVRHVLPGRRLLLAGTKAGLVMRRALELLGANESAARDRLDQAACELAAGTGTPSGVTVTGADNRDGTLRIAAEADGIGPAALWLAVVEHGIAEADRLLTLMADEVGPATSAVVAGGWTRMQSVRAAKVAALPAVRFSERSQAGAFGAAMFAAHAATVAASMDRAGDPTAVAVDRPSGPSQDFAAAFTAVPPWSQTQTPQGNGGSVPARLHQEISP